LGAGRGVFNLVLPQPAVSALHVTHDDGDVLEPALRRDNELHTPGNQERIRRISSRSVA
jgi:hypothetical protein